MIGFLLEHYAGKFPVWLSPEHARVIPINDSHNDYAQENCWTAKSCRNSWAKPIWDPIE